MTHLPFIAASYAVFFAAVLWLAVGAALRLTRAKARLAAIDPRAQGEA